MGKREAADERRHGTDFKEAACCPSAVVQGEAQRKNGLFQRSAREKWVPREGHQSFPPNPNEDGDRTTTLRWLLISAETGHRQHGQSG